MGWNLPLALQFNPRFINNLFEITSIQFISKFEFNCNWVNPQMVNLGIQFEGFYKSLWLNST